MIEFNENYDTILIQSSYYRVLVNHIQQLYPLVYRGLSFYSLLEQYVEPKIIEILELENEYRLQDYPLSGCRTLAYRDVYSYIKNDLEDYEKEEYLKEFGLVINPIIGAE